MVAVALREIRKYQKSTDLIIPKLSFSRLVKEIFTGIEFHGRIEKNALLGLQEAAEAILVTHFESIS